MKISTDEYVLYRNGFININKTILFSWFVMLVIIILAIMLKKLLDNSGKSNRNISSLQAGFELLFFCIEGQIKQISSKSLSLIFPFISTMFIYIFISNLISLIPTFKSPTGSFSTTLALAISVFIFSFYIGIKEKGLKFFKKYFEPNPILLPLNIIGDLSTVVSLSIRLYGNVMSSAVIVLILSKILFLSIGFPILIDLLSVIAGSIQAYIFSILSMIFISLDS